MNMETEASQLQCSSYNARKKIKLSELATSDRISELPDSLLHHILSFVNMRQIVKTSCVSSKWRYLWKSVPVLNFEGHPWKVGKRAYNKEKDLDFVGRVLLLHDDSNIQKLRLSNYHFIHSGRLNTWLLFASAHVKEVELDSISFSVTPHKLLNSLFASTIEVFEWKHVQVAAQLPRSVCSSANLRILRLVYVILPKGSSNGELILSCPCLETLILWDCLHSDLKILNISTPQLKKLVAGGGWRASPYHASSCKVIIRTPRLTSLHIVSSYYKEYILHNLTSLTSATFQDLYGAFCCRYLTDILNQITNVTALTIHGIEISPGSMDTLDQLLNPFSNLRCLKITTRIDSDIRVLTSLLKNSPYIERLVVEVLQVPRMPQSPWNPQVLPEVTIKEDWGEALSSQHTFYHLTCVRILNICCSENELKLLDFILKNAVILEDITIKCIQSNQLEGFINKLNSLPKASSGVKIFFA